MAAKRAKKTKKKAKAKRRTVAKVRRVAKRIAKAKPKRTKVRKTKAKAPVRKIKTSRSRKDVIGEGNYIATREFDKQQTNFVKKNRSRIPELAKEAEQALEGPQGDELRQAEEEAKSHAHTQEAAE